MSKHDPFGFIAAIQDHTLPNGLRVLLLPRREVPSVALAFAQPLGAIHDPAEAYGLATLTAAGIGDGTDTRTKQQIDEAIDFVGGGYSFSAGAEMSSGGMHFLAKDLPFALELLADTWRHPIFPPDEVQRQREQIEGSIRAQLEQPGTLVERTYREQVWAGTPYAHNLDGTLESLASIRPQDVAAAHQHHFGPAEGIIAIAGDFEPAATLARIAQALGDWSGGTPPAMPEPTREEPVGIVATLIDRPVQQANVRLGFQTLTRLDPDYYALLLANYIFGASSLSSRIGVAIRDNQGLAYQVASRLAALERTGLFTIVLQTSNATANRALAGLRDEIRKLQDEPVTGEELDEAKSYFRDRFPLTIETNSAMASQLLTIARFGFPLTHFRDYLEAIAATDAAAIQQAAQKYLFADAFTLTVVADAKAAQLELGDAVMVAS